MSWKAIDYKTVFVTYANVTSEFLYKLVNINKYLVKKYLYTINHKRLGLNYFYFSLLTAASGALLATAIRIEMAYPGSPFFNGDS